MNRLALWTWIFVWCGAVASAQPVDPGLYAEFQTSMGSFTARLDHDKAPRTVANFISLAEGTRPWLDFQRGFLRQQPFYDGITFHRVVTNFVIQAGSPNGVGNDGPGYSFNDEFHPDLRHERAGILSMAHSGPHSNGSQFFVTVVPTPWLDDRHSVFGEVVEGMQVVSNINHVSTMGGAPAVPVVIETVTVHRIGPAAEAFDPLDVTPSLPQLACKPTRLIQVFDNPDSAFCLEWEMESNAHYRIYWGLDLTAAFVWTLAAEGSGDCINVPFLSHSSVFFHVVERQSFEE